MTKNTFLMLVGLGLSSVAAVIVCGRLISGGDASFVRVSEALLNHAAMADLVGIPVRRIVQNGGPYEVRLASGGRRQGFYSIDVEGAKKPAKLKAYWRERSDHSIEILELFSSKDWAQDTLVWTSK
jgi:hypothetical protein